jgi:hypothetical protein
MGWWYALFWLNQGKLQYSGKLCTNTVHGGQVKHGQSYAQLLFSGSPPKRKCRNKNNNDRKASILVILRRRLSGDTHSQACGRRFSIINHPIARH